MIVLALIVCLFAFTIESFICRMFQSGGLYVLLDKYVEMCLLIDPLTIVLFCRHNYWDFLKKYYFDETYILGSY